MYQLKCRSIWKRAAALLTALALVLTVFSVLDLHPRARAEANAPEYTDFKYIDPIEGPDCAAGYANAVVATGGAMAGENYVYTQTVNAFGSLILERGLPAAKNISTYTQDGYLHMWVYVQDAAVLKNTPGDAWVDLGGAMYTMDFHWDLKEYVTQNGWNEIYLPLGSGAYSETAQQAASGIVYFRAFINQNHGSIFAIDDVYVCREAKSYGQIRMVDDTEALNGWVNATHIVGGAPAGSGYVLYSGAPDMWGNKVLARSFAKLNIAPYINDGYFHLHVYVDNADAVTGLVLDLSPDGFATNIEWNMAPWLYRNGWNELYLPFSAATVVRAPGTGEAAPDAGAISDIRIYVADAQTSILAVDDLYVCKEKKADVTYGAKKYLNKVPAGTTQWLTWNGGEHPFLEAQNADPAAAGINYVETSTTDSFGSLVLEHHFVAKRSFVGYENGYLHVRVYVDSLHGIGYGFIADQVLEIGDSWQLDSSLGWKLQNYIYQDGWNELYLPVNAPDITRGALTLDNVGYMRCYAKNGCTSKLRLSDVYFCKAGSDSPVDADPENVGAQKWIDPAEAAITGWYMWDGGNRLDALVATGGAPVGDHYIYANTPDSFGNVTLNYVLPQTKDFSGYENGWLHLWVYAWDLNAIAASGITVDISNETDILTNLYHWEIGKYLYQSGWNELYLPVSEATGIGSFDMSRLAFIRAYIPQSASSILALDDIYFCREGSEPPVVDPVDPPMPSTPTDPTDPSDPSEPSTPVEPERPENPGAQKWLDPVEKPDTGWHTWDGINQLPATMVNEEAPAGTYFMQSTTTDSFGSLTLNYTLPNAMDITGYEEGYLHLWVYVDALAQVQGSTSSVDITPEVSMSPTASYFSWHLADYLYQDGWNELYLPMTEAMEPNGGFDYYVGFMRVYTTNGVSTKLALDDIYFCREGGEPPVDKPDDGGRELPSIFGAQRWLDHVESTAGWYLDTKPYAVRKNAPDGSAYLETVTPDPWGSLFFARAWEKPMDLSRYDVENGYLHIWVYVENAAGLTNGYIELTSAGAADREEINWNLVGLVEDGWNELYLSLADAGMEGGYFNGSQVNFFRIFAQGVTKLGIDDIYVCLGDVDLPPVTGDTALLAPVCILMTLGALGAAVCGYALILKKKRQ